jgi:hypothetical protein
MFVLLHINQVSWYLIYLTIYIFQLFQVLEQATASRQGADLEKVAG